METEILMSGGIKAPCACTKFVLCPFPTTSWYYVTLCKHDNDSAPRALTPLMYRAYWWYDMSKQRMISAIAFTKKYEEMMVGHAPPLCAHDMDQFLHVRVREKIFAIGRGGQVNRLSPKPGGWL
jgi:hypothetical protein